MSRLIIAPARSRRPPNATPPIYFDGKMAYRLPDGDPDEAIHEVTGDKIPMGGVARASLAEAMAEFPDAPWGELSIFGGEEPEPELVAKVKALTDALNSLGSG